MKSYIWVFLALAIVSGCGKSSSGSSSSSLSSTSGVKQVKTVPEIEDSLSEIDEFMVVYLKGKAIDNLIVEYTDDDSGPLEAAARGYCVKSSGTPRIILYRADWVGPYAADSVMKKAAFYHLVGHCVFNKDHNDELFYSAMDGNPTSAKSYMHSNFGYQLFPSYYGGLTASRIIGLQKQFFNYTGTL